MNLQNNNRILPLSSKKQKKIYLDYSQVSPTYENHEFFTTPQIYSARNSRNLNGLKLNPNSIINKNINNQINQSEIRYGRSEDKQYDSFHKESHQLRNALYAVNNEQGMLIDNPSIDLYKRRKKSIPTIQSTSQHSIDQALKYYALSNIKNISQQNSSKSPSNIRSNRIKQNNYNDNFTQQNQNSINKIDQNNSSLMNLNIDNRNNFNIKNNNQQQYSTIDGKTNESTDFALSNRQQLRKIIGISSTRNSSPLKQPYGYSDSQRMILSDSKQQYLGLDLRNETKRNKSISIYSTKDLAINMNSRNSLASLDQFSSSQNNLNQITQKQYKIFSQNLNTNNNNNNFNSKNNLSLEPIEQNKQNRRKRDLELSQLNNSSASVSPQHSAEKKNSSQFLQKQNNSIDRSNSIVNLDRSSVLSQKGLYGSGSIIQLNQNIIKTKQCALNLPKIKVLIISLIEESQDIEKNYVKLELEKYWLSLMNKSVKLVADIELLQRVQPYIIEIMNSDYYLKFRSTNLQDKYILNEVSKWNFLKEIHSYEKGEIPQNKFYEFMIHYFLPTKDYREQLIQDLILVINKKIQKAFPFEVEDDVDGLMDINGKQINDLYDLNLSSQYIIAGNVSNLQSQFPIFQNQLSTYLKNKERINFIKERKQNFQQQFVVQESPSSPIITRITESPQHQSYQKSLKLPHILQITHNLNTSASISSFVTPLRSKKQSIDRFDLSMSNSKIEQKKITQRKKSISEFPDQIINNIYNKVNSEYKNKIIPDPIIEEEQQNHQQQNNTANKKVILKKSNKNSLYLTRNEIEQLLKEYPLLKEKDILNFHAEFQYLVKMNPIYEEKANIGVNSRLKKPFRDTLLYLQIFFSMNPSFQDKERPYQIMILEALQININVGDHQHSTFCWNDFFRTKACIANKLPHNQKIIFLQQFFNKYNLQLLSKQEFFDLIASARGTKFNLNSEKIILNGFQEEVWKEITQLQYIENDSIQIQDFFKNTPNNCRVIDDLIQWMFLVPYE